jgi:hypothetical protein
MHIAEQLAMQLDMRALTRADTAFGGGAVQDCYSQLCILGDCTGAAAAAVQQDTSYKVFPVYRVALLYATVFGCLLYVFLEGGGIRSSEDADWH